jgi:hypothetical protein
MMRKNILANCVMAIIGLIAAVAVVVSLVLLSIKSAGGKELTAEQAGAKVLELANNNFFKDKNAKLLGKPSQKSGLYEVSLSVGEANFMFYLTKDGKRIIFPDGIAEVALIEAPPKRETPKEAMLRSDIPSVELYVMSLCPYGVKALKEIIPAVNKFGEKIDFKVKYIVTVKGETLNDVESLHGIDEVKENLRQAAIMKLYPDKFGQYLDKINDKFCVISCGAVKLDDYWKEAASGLQMDTAAIESFANSKEGIELLKQHEQEAKKYEVSASPTLVINGVKSESIYGGAQITQLAVCSAFTVAPQECQSIASSLQQPVVKKEGS